MKRRDFLRHMGISSFGALALTLDHPLRPRFRLASAQTFAGKTLVVVFQRGGCDGMNMIPPHGDDDYYNLRPDIAIGKPSSDPLSAIDLNGFFGMHPSMAPLQPAFAAGELAIFPTAHYPNASRSHFRSQDWIEIGEPGGDEESSGWLARHLGSVQQSALIRAVGLGGSLPKALRGGPPVSVFNSLSGFDLNLPQDEEALLLASLDTVYDQTPMPPTAYRTLVHEVGRVVINDLDVVRGLDLDALGPGQGVEYPNNGFGRQLTDIARLIKADIGLEIATVNIGGWDTHSEQGGGDPSGRMARSLDSFARGIAAFRQDLGNRMDDVIVVGMTEFGRTIGQNASIGTDHGNACVWTVLGNTVNGGIYGTWPGLSEPSLYLGRYLAHDYDFRDILADVLVQHLNSTNLATLLPGHTHVPTGVLG